jgi:hypothetical protein
MSSPLQLTQGRKRLLARSALVCGAVLLAGFAAWQTSTLARQSERMASLEARVRGIEKATKRYQTSDRPAVEPTSVVTEMPSAQPASGKRRQLCAIVRILPPRASGEMTMTIRPAQLYTGDTAIAIARAHGVALQSRYYIDEASKTVDVTLLGSTPVGLLSSASRVETVTAAAIASVPAKMTGRWFYATIFEYALVLDLREIAPR